MRNSRRTIGRTEYSIPLVDLAEDYNMHSESILRSIKEVLRSGNYVLGENVRCFEKEFAAYCGLKFGIGVASGTDALTLSLMALGIGQNDEVITVANTASPTAMAILNARARPVFVDPSPQTFVMDASNIRRAVTDRMKAVIPVHLYGNPCDMPALLDFAGENNLAVIEDCCQAHGAQFAGKKVGSFGDVGCFSFYPTKNLGGVGDGGIVLTNSSELAHKLRTLRAYGMDREYNSLKRGLCSRLDEIQAAVLRVKLKWLSRQNEQRRKNAAVYRELLNDCEVLQIQKETTEGVHVYHQFVISVDNRDALRSRLTAVGIGTGVHYPVPLCDQPAFRRFSNRGRSLRTSRRLAKRVLSLPIHPNVKEHTIKRICREVNEFVEGCR